jgi:tRNA 2-thiouridine synthesizing protein A
MAHLSKRPTARLDALGLLCPLPVIRTQDEVRGLAAGSVLEVLATDPGAVHDIRAWCRVHGHQYLDDKPCENAVCGADQAHFHICLRVSD